MSFALVLKKTSWYRRRYSHPIRVKKTQTWVTVGLYIAGILRRLLERAVLSAIKLKHFFGKYRFVYIYFIDKIVTVLYIVQFYAEQHAGARCESLNERRS